MSAALSILDLAHIREGDSARNSFEASVALAQLAETRGYRRIWYAEHHNMASIGSSATSVLIAHVAAHTSTIRLGAGGIMLPNHAPLTIAEQFGTLETLHPGRIDLGLGRAPGSDQKTMYALRRDPASADRFPQDVLELQAYLAGKSRVPGVDAIPGKGTNVPLYILGSSLFGAQLAAKLGLPYANASHFSPDSLVDAVTLYRDRFEPSEQLAEPYVIAGVNAIAADTSEEAHRQFESSLRRRVVQMVGRGQKFTPEEVDLIMTSPAGQQITQMVRYSAVGTPTEVKAYLDEFAEHAQADELIVASMAEDTESWLKSYDLLADVWRSAPVRLSGS
ncbi:LLM class flavin-dependent oxidoreductase [Rhodococcus oxybenzonivorans]|uniref:LLM class flavin-dependent oxidoreductase n=1 Tax=Rhodococcus oxybenzonivorans TaxID=1990687 RepID=UPI00295476D6|nr:LLM class flavin-dependent oxidoreductase [Rhodococcus oxybenzonivorans]MDV7354911.1 LLM class flavin-dependent oxidoreductase [Rhodococcus oxybenzonivorans]